MLALSAPNKPYDIAGQALSLVSLLANRLGKFRFSSLINYYVLSFALFSLQNNTFCVDDLRRI